MSKQICIVTGTRAEYGLLRWIMEGIRQSPLLELQTHCYRHAPLAIVRAHRRCDRGQSQRLDAAEFGHSRHRKNI